MKGTFYDALLGAEFLQLRRVMCDYAPHQILFAENGLFRSDGYDRSVAFFVVGVGYLHRFVVHEGPPGSPAALDRLTKGCILRTITGTDAGNCTHTQPRALLSDPNRKTLALAVKRGGKTISST